MSIVKSFGCDCCGIIQDEAVMTGIQNHEDLFDKTKSYPIIMEPRNTLIHFCHNCYNDRVLMPSRMVDRKKDEAGYKAKLKEMTLILRQLCFRNWREKKFYKRLD